MYLSYKENDFSITVNHIIKKCKTCKTFKGVKYKISNFWILLQKIKLHNFEC